MSSPTSAPAEQITSTHSGLLCNPRRLDLVRLRKLAELHKATGPLVILLFISIFLVANKQWTPPWWLGVMLLIPCIVIGVVTVLRIMILLRYNLLSIIFGTAAAVLAPVGVLLLLHLNSHIRLIIWLVGGTPGFFKVRLPRSV